MICIRKQEGIVTVTLSLPSLSKISPQILADSITPKIYMDLAHNNILIITSIYIYVINNGINNIYMHLE